MVIPRLDTVVLDLSPMEWDWEKCWRHMCANISFAILIFFLKITEKVIKQLDTC
jgi:hypothetical protein